MKRALGYLLSVALLIGMLSGILVMPATAQEAVAATAVGDGDYNGDGEVDMYDYMAIAQYINGRTTLTTAQKQHLDVFADGVVDMYDAIALFRFINEDATVLGGVVQPRDEVYAQFDLEDAVYDRPVAVGETVELNLTASAVSSLLAMEMHLSYDAKTLRFVEAESASVNAAPVSSSGNELWLTKMWDEPVSLKEGEVIATLRFEVLSPISTSTALSVLSAKAVSVQALDGLYTQMCVAEGGSVKVDTSATTTTAVQNYVTYTIETVTHEGTIETGEMVELDITVSEVVGFNGMQLNLCFDDEAWEWVEGSFVGTVASFNFKTVNIEPLHPMTDKGEVWLTAMAMKGHALAQGEVIATVKLKAKQAIKTDSVIGACYSQASSYDGTMNGYVPLSTWVDGGVIVKKKTYTGPLGDYFYKDSVRVSAYQLVEWNGDFYFVGDYNKLVKNTTISLTAEFVAGHTYADGTALKAGKYTFDENGKMIIKNGPVGDYFYKNNTAVKAYQLVEWNGDFYFISDSNKIAKNKSFGLTASHVAGYTYADGTPLAAGTYSFDADGKMIIRDGVVGDYFYKNNVRLNAYQLVEWNGDFYFISDAHKIAKNKSFGLTASHVAGYTYADGTPFEAGTYSFDADGKMIIRDGVVGDYFYKNNVRLKAYQLVEWNGDFYFISDAHKIAKNQSLGLTASHVAGYTYADGTPLAAGTYSFDADGKMIIRDGVVGDYFYKNNVRLKAYQLVEWNGDFYFISDAHKIAKNQSLGLTASHVAGHSYADGTPLEAGTYSFDADGKMIIRDGVVGDYFYKNNVRLKAYQLVEWNGDFYFISDAHKIAKNQSLGLTASHVAGYTYADGTPLAVGTYSFDADGKMIIRDGVVGDYFYKNNVRQSAYQLVKYNGDFYFISDGNKVVKNTRVYLSDKFVEGVFTDEGYPLFAGYYNFDENGKLLY